jgi:calcineurin-like phosphoesterase family protein
MIRNWNAVVAKTDRVIHVGDFAHRCDPKRLRAIFSQLNGAKFLCPGNHDDATTRSLPWAGIKEIMPIVVDGTRIVACHYAMRTWPGKFRGAIHLYGHTHNRLPGTSTSLDVGVDAWDFRPVSLPEIMARLAMLPPSVDVETDIEPDTDGGFKP